MRLEYELVDADRVCPGIYKDLLPGVQLPLDTNVTRCRDSRTARNNSKKQGNQGRDDSIKHPTYL